MNTTPTISRDYGRVTWGALLVWWGVTELLPSLPDGTGAAGVGLILLGINAARMLQGVPVSGFSTTLGVLALALGALELAGALLALPFEIPVFAILLIVLGAIFLARALLRSQNE